MKMARNNGKFYIIRNDLSALSSTIFCILAPDADHMGMSICSHNPFTGSQWGFLSVSGSLNGSKFVLPVYCYYFAMILRFRYFEK